MSVRTNVLEVRGLRVYYHTAHGAVKAVEDVSFEIQSGETLGLVGESGSGKSTIAMSLLRLIKTPGRIEAGEVWLQMNGAEGPSPSALNLISLDEKEMRKLRLAAIALMPQGSMNSLNPVMSIRDQIADGFTDHGIQLPKEQLEARMHDLLARVGLPPKVLDMYPHELSGGMKQRVCIAIAISLRPRAIIADEPTSALDVVVQRQIMETLHKVQQDLGASVLLVGHDIGLMAQSVDRLGVMYAGRLLEVSPVKAIFAEALHPYTRLLIGSLPSLDRKGEFCGIPGLPPSPLGDLKGCPFRPRCPSATDRCHEEVPALKRVAPDRDVACHLTA